MYKVNELFIYQSFQEIFCLFLLKKCPKFSNLLFMVMKKLHVLFIYLFWSYLKKYVLNLYVICVQVIIIFILNTISTFIFNEHG